MLRVHTYVEIGKEESPKMIPLSYYRESVLGVVVLRRIRRL